MDNYRGEKKIARREGLVVGLVLIILAAGLIWAGVYARRESRDGEARAGLRQLKTELEAYYNRWARYPAEYDSGKYRYQVTEKVDDVVVGWLVSGQLENKAEPTSGFNQEYNIDWRITAEGQYEICGGTQVCADDEHEQKL